MSHISVEGDSVQFELRDLSPAQREMACRGAELLVADSAVIPHVPFRHILGFRLPLAPGEAPIVGRMLESIDEQLDATSAA